MIWPRSLNDVAAKRVIVAVQIVEICSDGLALEILPRTVAYAVTRIDCRLGVGSLGAQIGAPGFSSRPMALRQLLTMLVGAFKAPEIGALAGPGADDKEGHVRRLRQLRRRLLRRLLLCFDAGRHAERRERHCSDDKCTSCSLHLSPWDFSDPFRTA